MSDEEKKIENEENTEEVKGTEDAVAEEATTEEATTEEETTEEETAEEETAEAVKEESGVEAGESEAEKVSDEAASENAETVSAEAEVESENGKDDVAESEEPKEESSKSVNISTTLVAVVGCLALIAAVVVLVVYMLPRNRIKRYMNAADTAYAEQGFDKAYSNYKKAEALDETNYKAVKGKLLSMSATDDPATEEAAFEALTDIADRKSEFTDEERKDCEELYLVIASLLNNYEENGPKYCAKMDAAYETLGAPGTLSAALSDSCGQYADTLGETGTEGYTKIYLFERAFEVSSSDVFKSAGAQEADVLIGDAVSRDAYDEARSVVSDFGGKFEFDIEAQNARIDKAESLYNTKNRLMSAVYEAMKKYYDSSKDTFSEDKFKSTEGLDFGMLDWDWIEMQTIDGSDDAQLLSENCENGRILWAPEGFSSDYTGLACGLYTYGESFTDADGVTWISYYFFFGEYKNGVRDGYGVSFIKIKDTSFYGFEGLYANDNPEGFGVYYKKNTYAYTSLAEYTEVAFSNYIAGYQDGVATVRVSLNEQPGTYYEGIYEVAAGVPKEVPAQTEQYEVLNPIPEGYVLIGVLPNITDGFDNFMIYRNPEGSKKGAIGYE